MRENRTYGGDVASYSDQFPPVTSKKPETGKVPFCGINLGSVIGTKSIMASYVGNCIVKSN